jgi:hypothetical protein
MTEIVVSPHLPKWVLDTFEGKLLDAWIGCSSEQGDLVEFTGNTENEDNEDIILLEMNPDEVKEFAVLAEEAGTPICKDIARLLKDPEGTGIMNEYFGKIDISSIRIEVEIKDEKGRNLMMDPDHLLLSLVSRFPEEIPYVETSWARGGTFITPSGVEWFKKKAPLEARKAEFLASMKAEARKA